MTGVDELVTRRCPTRSRTRLVVGGEVDGYDPYEDAVGAYPGEPLEEELEGHAMMYSSGTTGRPKGIKYPLGAEARRHAGAGARGDGSRSTAWTTRARYLSPAPLYHSAPLQFCIAMTSLRRHRA